MPPLDLVHAPHSAAGETLLDRMTAGETSPLSLLPSTRWCPQGHQTECPWVLMGPQAKGLETRLQVGKGHERQTAG